MRLRDKRAPSQLSSTLPFTQSRTLSNTFINTPAPLKPNSFDHASSLGTMQGRGLSLTQYSLCEADREGLEGE